VVVSIKTKVEAVGLKFFFADSCLFSLLLSIIDILGYALLL
jgi:hypothetical protein